MAIQLEQQKREIPSRSIEGLLLTRPLPRFYPEQVQRYNPESLHLSPAGIFTPTHVQEVLRASVDESVMTVDIGGDKARYAIGKVQKNGQIKLGEPTIVESQQQGANYLPLLEDAGKIAEKLDIPVGVSTAGIVEQNGQPTDYRMLGTLNLNGLTPQIDAKYSGDLTNIWPTLASLDNDAPPPLKATFIQALETHPGIENAIEIIVGGGLGGTVLQKREEDGKGQMFAAEPGHVAAVPELLTVDDHRVTEKCQVGGQSYDFVCIENVTGSNAMKKISQSLLGEALNGKAMVQKLQTGTEQEKKTILDILDNSANAVAHVVMGFDNAFGGKLLADPSKTLLVWHGGIFEIPEYRERVEQILKSRLQKADKQDVQLISMKTSDVDPNAAMIGAGMSALVNRKDQQDSAGNGFVQGPTRQRYASVGMMS